MEKFHYFVKTKYYKKYLMNIVKVKVKYCKRTSWMLLTFYCTFRCTKCLYIFPKFWCVFKESFLSVQIKVELYWPEIISALEDKESLSHFRVYRKSEADAQTDGRITTHGPLYTGSLKYVQIMFHWLKILGIEIFLKFWWLSRTMRKDYFIAELT